MRWRILVLSALPAALAVGCATLQRLPAVPSALQSEARVVGFPVGIRYFPRDAAHVGEFEKDYLASNERERKALQLPAGADMPPSAFLAISGGGDDGAFGAGLLNGWTKAGTRPVFKVVTGVSTGALIAPFAFLGPAYDERLKALYTHLSIKDIAKTRSLLSAFYGDSMADNGPLKKLIEKSITREMLNAIAAEHEKGRILLVATTNLDLRRPVIWNITEIAAERSPKALDLVHRILIASSAIPGTFPPVMIEAEVGGKRYQEMHVDGGTASQVFVYPAAIKLQQLAARERSLYVIRNARIDPEWAQVDRRTLPIALRSITCLIQNQGVGDLYRIYSIAERDHIDYNLAFIPAGFQYPHLVDFDTAYMAALFDLGERMGRGGNVWFKSPPVLVSGVDEKSPDAMQ
jgi:predicted patatin/cPLA2 family phospholipase